MNKQFDLSDICITHKYIFFFEYNVFVDKSSKLLIFLKLPT